MSTGRCPFLAQLAAMPRLTEARYADGLGELYETTDPMEVAQGIFDQDGNMPSSVDLSTMFVTWGQFLDHDLSLTPEADHETMEQAGFAHPIGRSEYLEGTGDDEARVQVNAITWQIDGSNVYGSSAFRIEDVRSFEGGKLKLIDDPTSDRGLLPKANADTLMAGDITSDDPVFLAGDIRANENPNLLSMHTLWAREHNYWADKLAEDHPDWDDEQLFNGAREIVEYQLQKITYEEWLPHLVGNVMPDPEDIAFDPDANGEIAIEFSTAAFRFGHTMVSSSLNRVNDDGTVADGGHLSLMDAFFNPDSVKTGGIDSLLRGQGSQHAQELDTKVIDDLNFFLATPDGVSGFSLPALNLMRGADHGLQSYIDTRAALLGDVDPDTIDPTDFSVITADATLQAELASVYDTVHDVDLWVGGLAEDKMPGAQAGPLFTHILTDQFLRTASADNTFLDLDAALGADIIAEVKGSTFKDVILRNTDIDVMQDDPFTVAGRDLTADWDMMGDDGDNTFDVVSMLIRGDLRGLDGDDTATLTGGTIVEGDISMGAGADSVAASSGRVDGYLRTDNQINGMDDDTVDLSGTFTLGYDVVTAGGDDDIALSDMAHVTGHILAGTGDDSLTLTNKAKVDGGIFMSEGNDTVSLGARTDVDMVKMGHGADEVTVEVGANVTHIDGGEENCFDNPDDNTVQDVLRVVGRHQVDWQDGDPSSEAGTIAYLDADGNATGDSFTFKNFEMVTCFTPGTRIVTANGKTPIEDLRIGQRVLTLDHGLQPIRWIGRVSVPAQGNLAPIRIRKGALGNTRDLLVSPQHRMLIGSALAELMFGSEDVLATAKALINDGSIRPEPGGMVEYIHLMFDTHQIVLAEGIPSESFHPGEQGLAAMEADTRAELLALFPELARDVRSYGPAARLSLKQHEAALLMHTAAPKIPKGCPFHTPS